MCSLTANPCDNCIKLSELDSQYRTLISKISHEIRNPLTLIYSSVQLLEKQQPAVTASFLWPQIKQDIQDTIRLLQDISILNRNNLTQRQSFSVSALLEGISYSFHSLMQEKGISLETKLDPGFHSRLVSGDEILLKEGIANLLMNSADALSSCSGSGQILLSAAADGDQLVIHVRDNGPGIPQDYLPTLFDPFVTHKSGGTGLGLSIAKNAAIQHSGTLTVQTSTDSNSYTDFCLSLPLLHTEPSLD